MDTIAVVGASLAGVHAARTLRADGFAGRLVVVDAQAHQPYDKPPLSKQVLRGEWSADRLTLHDAVDLDADWRLGVAAASFDLATRLLVLADGERLTADGLVVATGAAPRRLPGTEGVRGIHVVRTLDDALAIRAAVEGGARRAVVIGAGFIGGEVAASLCLDGLDVTLVEAMPVPLERAVGPVVGGLMADIHRDHGVDVRLGVGVDRIEDEGGAVRAVVLADGAVLPADLVVVGIGVFADTGWLEGSGVELDDGVVCDETLLAAPGVVAAGDVARWLSRRARGLARVEHWEHAIAGGQAAARRLLVGDGLAEVFDPVPWFWSDQFDRKLQLAGRGGAGHQFEIVHGSLEERRFVGMYGHDGLLTGVLGMNRPRHVMQLRTLVEQDTPYAEALVAGRAA